MFERSLLWINLILIDMSEREEEILSISCALRTDVNTLSLIPASQKSQIMGKPIIRNGLILFQGNASIKNMPLSAKEKQDFA